MKKLFDQLLSSSAILSVVHPTSFSVFPNDSIGAVIIQPAFNLLCSLIHSVHNKNSKLKFKATGFNLKGW